MQEIRAGELLWKFRNEKGISTRRICKGICSETAFSNYESGKRAIDFILLERLLERLGIVTSNFAFMLNESEYAYYVWKSQCIHAVDDKNWDELEELLAMEIGTKIVGNPQIQQQFHAYMSAILSAEKYNQYEMASIFLYDAVHKTIPDVSNMAERKLCLGEMEIQIVLLYLYYGLRGNCISSELAEQLFQGVSEFCERQYVEKGVKVKCYVRLVCIWVKYGKENMTDVCKIELCQKAICLLREHQFFFDITELLEIYIALLQKSRNPKVVFYSKQYEAFCEMMQYAGMNIEFRPEVMGIRSPEVYLITEYLQYRRREMGLSQEKISEGICEPETYSRLETGIRSPSPTNRNALSERLGIGWCYYRGNLDTDNRQVYYLRKEQRTAAIKNQWQESLDILKEMEQLLDMKLPLNQQYIFAKRILARQRMNVISTEEAYNQYVECLGLTMELNIEAKELVYYSDTELEIIGHMGQLLREMKRNSEAIKLLEGVLYQLSQSKIDNILQWNGVGFVQRVLSGLYFSINDYQRAYELLYEVYAESVHYYSGGNLVTMLANMSDALEHIGEQHSKEYKQLCRLAYYVADFFYIQYAKESLQNYYEKKYEQGYVWYPI